MKKQLRTGFIGAGKVGCTLGKYLAVNSMQVAGYYSRSTRSAEEAAQFTNTAAYADMAGLAKDCDVLFLTVPDGSIHSVYEELRQETSIKGKYICHCSGALTAKEVFPGIKDAGAFGYSVHPLFAVSSRFEAYRELTDVFFAMEGDSEHAEELLGLLHEAGLKVNLMDGTNKTEYHAAATICSNLVTALLAQSMDMLKDCGFSEEDSRRALAPLIRGNVEHVLDDGPVESLTGPVERGDADTVERHLAIMKSAEDRRLYALLSGKLLLLAGEKHPDRSYEAVEKLLARYI